MHWSDDMTAETVEFDDITDARFGGKAAGLAELRRLGLAVPPGFVLAQASAPNAAEVARGRFDRMAAAMLNGAGTFGGKSKLVNSPGKSCIAKVIVCFFHCSRSSMPSSAKRFIMFGYAPKKMCRPVSIQSPSSSCHADTLPPSTSRASSTSGSWPESDRYLAHDRPLRPPPMMATFFLLPCHAPEASFCDSAHASRYGSVLESCGGFGKSFMTGAAATRPCAAICGGVVTM